MSLTQNQINNLITGIALSAELPAVCQQNRRFIKVMAYELNEHGRAVRTDKRLDSGKIDVLHFILSDYEYPALYIEKDQEVPDRDIVSHSDTEDIIGIAELEEHLSAVFSDFSSLVPEWETDDVS